MQAESPLPEGQSSHTDQERLKNFLAYESDVRDMHEQLRVRNDLRKVAESAIIENFVKRLTDILSKAEYLQEATSAVPEGINTFCERMEDAIIHLYAAKKALERNEGKFADVDIEIQAYNTLRKSHKLLSLVLAEFHLMQERLQKLLQEEAPPLKRSTRRNLLSIEAPPEVSTRKKSSSSRKRSVKGDA